MAQPKTRWHPRISPREWWHWPRWQFVGRLPAAVALVIVVAVVGALKSTSSGGFSGQEFAKFAVDTHKLHTQGAVSLDIRSDSEQELNRWLRERLPFALTMPDKLPVQGEERPYRLKGAKLLQAGGQPAVYIGYEMESGPASLVVAPVSLAVASGGVETRFEKVTFHYSMIDGYKVVTWSLHGRTYALTSQEGNNRQQSCMVCHSAMKDRDLTHTPTPLQHSRNTL
jgi:anti-sigma factor RsiW